MHTHIQLQNASTTHTRKQICTHVKIKLNMRHTHMQKHQELLKREKTRFEDRYWYRKRNKQTHTWTSTFAYTITHPERTSETQEERDAEWNCFQKTLRVWGQKWRDTARKRPSTKIRWLGASHLLWEHDDWLLRKKKNSRSVRIK